MSETDSIAQHVSKIESIDIGDVSDTDKVAKVLGSFQSTKVQNVRNDE